MVISRNSYSKITDEYEIHRFFSFYSKNRGYGPGQVDELYRFLRRVDLNSVSCVKAIAEYMSVHSKIFENNLSYTISLTNLYIAMSRIVNLNTYHVCDTIHPRARAIILCDIIREYYKTSDKKYKEFIEMNFRALVKPLDYFNMDAIEYKDLFRSDTQLEYYIKLVYKVFDEKDAFDILYCLYKYLKEKYSNEHYYNLYMRLIDRKTKIKLILNYYPIVRNIKHWYGYDKIRI